MSKKLLSEAIADAKLVKKTAIANAKVALEEAFRPTIAGLVSNKIREEEGEDEFENDDDVHIDVNYGGEGGEMDVAPEEPAMEPEGEEAGMGFDSFGGEEEAPATDEVPAEEDDMELESLIRELEGEDDEMMEGDDYGDEEPMEEDVQDRWANPPVPKVGDTDPVIEALIKELEDDGEDYPMTESEDGGGSYEENGPSERGMNVESLRRQLRQKTKDLNESYSVITKLKTVINEVNLLNAKLMYTTKALRQNPYLSEAQQNKVMDAIDRGNTVREVKLVYAAIVEGFKRSTSSGKAKKMVEGLASKSTPVMNPKGKQNLSEDVIRWQELAGLRKLRD